MKKFPLKNWQFTPELDCLLFFSQRMTEVLFDYTYASYKYPALYSASICEEAIEIIQRIEDEELSPRAIEPIIEELKWRVSKDYIVKEIVGKNLDEYLNFSVTDLKEQKLKLNLLYNKISPRKYIIKVKETLSSLIKENKEKKLINKIIPNFVASLIDLGYSQCYIHLQTTKFFFFRDKESNKITVCDEITEYFKLFPLTFQDYEVVFKGSQLFSLIKEPLKTFNIEIPDEIKPATTKIGEINFLKLQKDQVFLHCKNIRALDHISAKNIADSSLQKISALFNYFHHKQRTIWSHGALVYQDNRKTFYRVGKSISPVFKCNDIFPSTASLFLNKLLENFGLESKSFNRFDKAIDLHAVTTENFHVENQLLHFWIALETILVGYSQESKIDQILKSLKPAISLKYLESLILDFEKDIFDWNKEFTVSVIKDVPEGKTNIEKISALISLNSNKELRERFYANLSDFPLLKFRLSMLNEIFSQPKEILRRYNEHSTKINWQIRRIYRTRNLIVHTGYVPSYTEILVENIHLYLDDLLNLLVDFVTNGRLISDIAQGIKEIQILQSKHEKFLNSSINDQINNSNLQNLIFGFIQK